MFPNITVIGPEFIQGLLKGALAFAAAALLAFALTPLVRVFAFKIGGVDVPKDDRRMHSKPIPTIGGLAVFLAFAVAVLLFAKPSASTVAALGGGLLLIIVGILDDIFDVRAIFKFLVQIAAAILVMSQGVRMDYINFFGTYIEFKIFAYPITLLWIVGLTNALNLIDGLDGLSCGIAAISCVALFLTSLGAGDPAIIMLTAILGGACIGFLPFNKFPAKIFIGDTGATFLGFMLSVISIQGLFKTHALLSFVAPFMILGVPIFDTLFAIFRRLLTGRHPFSPDRGHLHHRLIDLGFTQTQTVRILYAVSALLGIAAVILTLQMLWQALVILVLSMAIAAFTWVVINNKETRCQSGLADEPESPDEPGEVAEKSDKDE